MSLTTQDREFQAVILYNIDWVLQTKRKTFIELLIECHKGLYRIKKTNYDLLGIHC